MPSSQWASVHAWYTRLRCVSWRPLQRCICQHVASLFQDSARNSAAELRWILRWLCTVRLYVCQWEGRVHIKTDVERVWLLALLGIAMSCWNALAPHGAQTVCV